MENNVLKDAKKLFSKLGMRLFVGTIILTIISIVGSAVFQVVLESNPALAENADVVFLMTMLPNFIIGYPAILWMLSRIPVQAQPAEQKKMSVGQVLVAICMSYFITMVANWIGLLITGLVGKLKGGEVSNVLMDITAGVSSIWIFLIVAVAAPVVEELIFRKFFLDRIAQYGEGIAIVMSGILFGLFHGNLNQFAYAFGLGCFFAFVYMKTRKVLYPILLHMGVNFWGTFVSSLVLKYGNAELLEASADVEAAVMNNPTGTAITLGFTVCTYTILIIGLVCWIKARKKFKLEAGEIVIPKGKKFSTCILNVGMILFCAIWIVTMIAQLFA